MNYWDTSALLKLYVPEADSSLFMTLAESVKTAPLSSSLASIEMLAGLHRKEFTGALPIGHAQGAFHRFESHVNAGHISLTQVGSDCLREAQRIVAQSYGRTPPILLRAADAVHLGTSIVVGSKAFVSADVRQRSAALLMGLRVLP